MHYETRYRAAEEFAGLVTGRESVFSTAAKVILGCFFALGLGIIWAWFVS